MNKTMSQILFRTFREGISRRGEVENRLANVRVENIDEPERQWLLLSCCFSNETNLSSESRYFLALPCLSPARVLTSAIIGGFLVIVSKKI